MFLLCPILMPGQLVFETSFTLKTDIESFKLKSFCRVVHKYEIRTFCLIGNSFEHEMKRLWWQNGMLNNFWMETLHQDHQIGEVVAFSLCNCCSEVFCRRNFWFHNMICGSISVQVIQSSSWPLLNTGFWSMHSRLQGGG